MRTISLAESHKDRLIHERVHDPYRMKRKPPEPTVCPVCNVVFKNGRWQWLEFWPASSRKQICQACRRIKDNYPAGLVMISGDFARTHRTELLNLVRNHEKIERDQHPFNRIIEIKEQPDAVTVTTTDIHLPKRIGEALDRAHQGTLAVHYEAESHFVRVNWTSKP